MNCVAVLKGGRFVCIERVQSHVSLFRVGGVAYFYHRVWNRWRGVGNQRGKHRARERFYSLLRRVRVVRGILENDCRINNLALTTERLRLWSTRGSGQFRYASSTWLLF